MKNLLALSILFGVAIVSCNKEKPTEVASSIDVEQIADNNNNLAVDSVKVHDSLKIHENLTVNFKAKIVVFTTLKNNMLLDSIYAPTEIRLPDYSKENLKNALDVKKNTFFEEEKNSLADFQPEFAQNWEKNSNMKLFAQDNDYLTIQYTADGYTGGAHGYYVESYKVFDLKNNYTVQLTDIISKKNSTLWNSILMENFIQNDGDKGQVEMLLVKEIPLNSNFYFDKKFLYFLYNQYEITAYAAGPVLIKVPLSDIKPLLTDEFIKRQDL